MQTQRSIRRALLSVSDKTGLVEFAHRLNQLGIELIATDGSAKLLRDQNIPVTPIAEYTNFPEMMDGRVKTLHPKIYGGLLGRRGVDDAVMQQHDIPEIDLLIANLYPFAATIAKKNCQLKQAIEQIDIGGPAMLRAAAKNYQHVTVIIDPADYQLVLTAINAQQMPPLKLRQQLAKKVFTHTSEYDRMIANYLQQQEKPAQTSTEHNAFAAIYQPTFILQQELRYGENPHQAAALYHLPQRSENSLAAACLLQGKALSYNNMIDADCALNCVQELAPQQAACVIVKHATPCGIAQGKTPQEAYQKAYQCDPESAFGGIIALNQTLDENLANAILQQQFVEVIITPTVTDAAKQKLAQKPNLRLLTYCQTEDNYKAYAAHSISGGLLLQQQDKRRINANELTCVTKRQPTAQEIDDLLFAWRAVKFIKSNAIVFAKNQATLGIGCGQTSRVFAANIAILRATAANLSLENSVLASDAFFPFADSVETAAAQKVTAIIQPGGSKRDNEVIAAANAANIAMVFTGIRHFRH
jgi:phosphoribosylaminoimidazolecarboxamide formyltransferase/IMP cyclohydrolase